MVKKIGQVLQRFNAYQEDEAGSRQIKQAVLDIFQELCVFFKAVVKFVRSELLSGKFITMLNLVFS